MKEAGLLAIYKCGAGQRDPATTTLCLTWRAVGLQRIPGGLWDPPQFAPHPWQQEILGVQSCLLRKGTVRISSGHFQPVILYMETSHPGVCSIMSTTPGRSTVEASSPLAARTHSFSRLPGPAVLDWTLSSNGSPDLCWGGQASGPNMEQLEEDPAFFSLHKHWGLCSPSCCRMN